MEYNEHDNGYDEEFIAEDVGGDDIPKEFSHENIDQEPAEVVSVYDNEMVKSIQAQAQVYFDSRDYRQGCGLICKTIEDLSREVDRASSEFVIFFTEMVSYMNNQALRYLNDDDCEPANEILRICSEITLPEKYGIYPSLRILTFNHLGCTKRRQGNLKLAHKYMLKALNIMNISKVKDHAGITHLNICAVCSQLGDHLQALEHAKSAVFEFSHEYIVLRSNPNSLSEPLLREIKEKAKYLAIAYYNMGLEEECFDRHSDAQNSYEKAYKIIHEIFGENEPLLQKFRQAYYDATEKWSGALAANTVYKGMRGLGGGHGIFPPKGNLTTVRRQRPSSTKYHGPRSEQKQGPGDMAGGFYFQGNQLREKQQQQARLAQTGGYSFQGAGGLKRTAPAQSNVPKTTTAARYPGQQRQPQPQAQLQMQMQGLQYQPPQAQNVRSRGSAGGTGILTGVQPQSAGGPFQRPVLTNNFMSVGAPAQASGNSAKQLAGQSGGYPQPQFLPQQQQQTRGFQQSHQQQQQQQQQHHQLQLQAEVEEDNFELERLREVGVLEWNPSGLDDSDGFKERRLQFLKSLRDGAEVAPQPTAVENQPKPKQTSSGGLFAGPERAAQPVVATKSVPQVDNFSVPERVAPVQAGPSVKIPQSGEFITRSQYLERKKTLLLQQEPTPTANAEKQDKAALLMQKHIRGHLTRKKAGGKPKAKRGNQVFYDTVLMPCDYQKGKGQFLLIANLNKQSLVIVAKDLNVKKKKFVAKIDLSEYLKPGVTTRADVMKTAQEYFAHMQSSLKIGGDSILYMKPPKPETIEVQDDEEIVEEGEKQSPPVKKGKEMKTSNPPVTKISQEISPPELTSVDAYSKMIESSSVAPKNADGHDIDIKSKIEDDLVRLSSNTGVSKTPKQNAVQPQATAKKAEKTAAEAKKFAAEPEEQDYDFEEEPNDEEEIPPPKPVVAARPVSGKKKETAANRPVSAKKGEPTAKSPGEVTGKSGKEREKYDESNLLMSTVVELELPMGVTVAGKKKPPKYLLKVYYDETSQKMTLTAQHCETKRNLEDVEVDLGDAKNPLNKKSVAELKKVILDYVSVETEENAGDVIKFLKGGKASVEDQAKSAEKIQSVFRGKKAREEMAAKKRAEISGSSKYRFGAFNFHIKLIYNKGEKILQFIATDSKHKKYLKDLLVPLKESGVKEDDLNAIWPRIKVIAKSKDAEPQLHLMALDEDKKAAMAIQNAFRGKKSRKEVAKRKKNLKILMTFEKKCGTRTFSVRVNHDEVKGKIILTGYDSVNKEFAQDLHVGLNEDRKKDVMSFAQILANSCEIMQTTKEKRKKGKKTTQTVFEFKLDEKQLTAFDDQSKLQAQSASYQKLGNVDISFEEGLVNTETFFDEKTQNLVLYFKSPRFLTKSLKIPIHDMGLDKFNATEFRQRMDTLLLSRLSVNGNQIVFDARMNSEPAEENLADVYSQKSSKKHTPGDLKPLPAKTPAVSSPSPPRVAERKIVEAPEVDYDAEPMEVEESLGKTEKPKVVAELSKEDENHAARSIQTQFRYKKKKDKKKAAKAKKASQDEPMPLTTNVPKEAEKKTIEPEPMMKAVDRDYEFVEDFEEEEPKPLVTATKKPVDDKSGGAPQPVFQPSPAPIVTSKKSSGKKEVKKVQEDDDDENHAARAIQVQYRYKKKKDKKGKGGKSEPKVEEKVKESHVPLSLEPLPPLGGKTSQKSIKAPLVEEPPMELAKGLRHTEEDDFEFDETKPKAVSQPVEKKASQKGVKPAIAVPVDDEFDDLEDSPPKKETKKLTDVKEVNKSVPTMSPAIPVHMQPVDGGVDDFDAGKDSFIPTRQSQPELGQTQEGHGPVKHQQSKASMVDEFDDDFEIDYSEKQTPKPATKATTSELPPISSKQAKEPLPAVSEPKKVEEKRPIVEPPMEPVPESEEKSEKKSMKGSTASPKKGGHKKKGKKEKYRRDDDDAARTIQVQFRYKKRKEQAPPPQTLVSKDKNGYEIVLSAPADELAKKESEGEQVEKKDSVPAVVPAKTRGEDLRMKVLADEERMKESKTQNHAARSIQVQFRYKKHKDEKKAKKRTEVEVADADLSFEDEPGYVPTGMAKKKGGEKGGEDDVQYELSGQFDDDI